MTAPKDAPAPTTKPNPIVAFVLGTVCPGAGLVYAGLAKIGFTVAALFALSAVIVPVLIVELGVDLGKFPGLVRGAALAFWGPSAVFGVVAAAIATPAPRKPSQHLWWILGLVVITWSVRFGLNKRVVEPYLVSFATPSEAQLRKVAPEGADVSGVYAVLKRRFAPADLKADAWVLLADANKQDAESHERIARIVSTESGLVLDDGTKVSPADILAVGALAR